jgi:cytoskeletal protein CcmA (bactofilin family)
MFQKKSAPTPRQTTDTTMTSGSTFSVLGADVLIKGNIKATTDLHIDGRVEGDIDCASLVLGETSSVAGAVVATSARISGEVQGTIHAGDLVILRSARISGDVHYESLSIEQGAVVDGRFAQRQPAAQALIEG